METHIGITMYGDTYRGYNVRRLIQRLQFMEIRREGKIYGDSYMCTICGDSYRGTMYGVL